MYKIKLTNDQIETIKINVDDTEKRKKLMSVLSYLIKYTDPETNTLTKSLNKLYNMYVKLTYRKISNCYFYKLVDWLEEHGLFTAFRKTKVSNLVSKSVSNLELVEPIENTNIYSNSKKHNDLIYNNTNTYTLYTSNDVKVSALELVEEVFQDLKVKSKIIKSMVIARLQNTVLDAKGSVAYIVKVIAEKTEQYNLMRIKYAQKVAETKYSKSKNTFVALAKANSRTFNNFDTREYDYDKLERKLLGWEN